MSRKKTKEVISSGKVCIEATFNNTTISITDTNGNVVGWSTAGKLGFKGTKKSTPYAAQVAAKNIAEQVKKDYSMSNVVVYVKGPGPGKEAAIRGVGEIMHVESIWYVTNIPHNGPRASEEPRK